MATNEEIMTAVQQQGLQLADFRKDVCEHLHSLDAKAVTLTDQVSALTEAKRSSSLRAKSLTEADTEQAKALEQEVYARQDLAKTVDALTTTNATQLAILSRLDKVASNPTLKLVATVIAAMFLQWAATKGLASK